MNSRTYVCISVMTALLSVAWADDLCPVTSHPAPQHPPVTLVRSGAAAAVIVAPTKPARELGAALQDLQLHIQKITGVKLAITDAPVEGMAALVVTVSPDDKALFPTPVGPEGFAVKTGPDRVMLAGQDEIGVSWAIYDFIERTLGVRWYWPEDRDAKKEWIGTFLPQSDTLTVAPAHWTDAPHFRKRSIYPAGGRGCGTADLRGLHRRLRAEQDSWPTVLIVHAPHRWDKLYQETRPEIFQLRGDGQRDFDMLCYGNPNTLTTYLEQIEKQLAPTEETPDRSIAILRGKAITVSPADIPVACTCENCRALWNSKGGRYGTASKILATFVSKLAQEVKTRWPDMTVVFLPYQNYTYAPEGVAFPDNVEVQICGMPGLALHNEPAVNAAEQANIDAWVRLTGRRVQNWHYSCWPEDRTEAAYLFPNVISAHYRANRDKTVGSFINGVKDHWPRQHVSLYVWLKTLWNPDFDAPAAIEGFVTRMYGPAAQPMRDLINMQIKGWEENRWPDAVFAPKTVYEISYPTADVKRMEALLADAFERAKADPLVTKRLEYVAGPLRSFFQQSAEYAGGTGLQTLELLLAVEDPVIDGKLDDDVWKGIEGLPFVMATDRDQPQPKFPTAVQAVWTRRGVTFGFHMSEPEPATLMRDIGVEMRDASLLWWDDNVELFLDVTGKQVDYYHIIVNANGAIADFHGKDATWDAAGLRTAAFVGPDFWSLEVFVPYTAFAEVEGPGTGVAWTGNFTRHRVTDKKNREYQRFNTRYAVPSRDQNAFGLLPFIEQ